MSDSRKLILAEFDSIIQIANTSSDPNVKWKKNNYNKVIAILKRITDTITTTDEALTILRREGMKFVTEKKLPYKSKILLNIQEIITQGYLTEVKLNKEDPKVKIINQLMLLPEIGPTKAEKLYQQNIRSLNDLEDKPELLNRKQLIGLRHYKDLSIRIPRKEMDQWNNILSTITQQVFDTIKNNSNNSNSNIINMELVGSYRRGLSTSGDVDFYIACKNVTTTIMKCIINSIIALKISKSQDVISQGNKKTMLIAKLPDYTLFRHIDIFIFPKDEYPFALMYATGSADFNIKFRNYALSIGWSLSDKAIRKGNPKGEIPTQEELIIKINKLKIETEHDIFTFLNVQYISPNNRLPNAPLELLH